MKKTEATFIVPVPTTIMNVCKSTSVIKDANYMIGLEYINTKKTILELDKYEYDVDKKRNLIFLERNDGRITIWDANNNRFICKDFFIKYNDEYYSMILQDPSTNKYHIYTKINNSFSFDKEFDNANFLTVFYDTERFYSVTKDSKKATYGSKSGLSDFIYKDITYDKDNDLILLDDGKYKSFIAHNHQNKTTLLSTNYDSLDINKKKVYAKRNNKTHIYDIDYEPKLLFTTDIYDKITLFNERYIEKDNVKYKQYDFVVEKNGKKGLLTGTKKCFGKDDNAIELTRTTDIKYDEIKENRNDNNIYELYLNGKKGFICRNAFDNTIVEANSDDIYYGHNIFALKKGNKYDIYYYDNTEIEKEVETFQIVNDGILIKKDGQVYLNNLSKHYPYKSEKYDDIDEYDYRVYLLKKDDKKGIIINEEVILEPIYDDIDFEVDDKEYSSSARKMFFALKIGGKYKLAKINKDRYNRNWNTESLSFNNFTFNDIKLLNDVMVLYRDDATYILNYEETVVKTLPPNIIVTEFEYERDYHKYNAYLVDGVPFYYNRNNFEKMTTSETNMYCAVYEYDEAYVVVNDIDKDDFKRHCETIERINEEEANKIILALKKKNS